MAASQDSSSDDEPTDTVSVTQGSSILMGTDFFGSFGQADEVLYTGPPW